MAFISKLKAGDFNTRISILSPQRSQDDFGGASTSYTTLTQVWANKNVKTLRDVEEKFQGDELQSYARFVFTVRYTLETKSIKSNYIIQDQENGDKYDILGFVIDPRKEYIEIFVKQDLPTNSF